MTEAEELKRALEVIGEMSDERERLKLQVDELKKQLEFMPALKECSAAHQRRADAAELQISELELQREAWRPVLHAATYLIGKNVSRPEIYKESDTRKYQLALALSKIGDEARERLLKEKDTDRLLGEAVALLRESRQYAGVDWMVKADNFLIKIDKRDCAHEWAHIEDHHVICKKCKHTADLCWTCESEKTRTRDGGLVCLKCNPQ